ncbi:hypothetical protein [Nonomuraea sp. bgisy101]|uniref:hypothetical protein n=1 Tax=Nonomuraea sp. bgisy101 TaxID=3413784 RepID=UPI003D753EE9
MADEMTELRARIRVLEECVIGAWELLEGAAPPGQETWYSENIYSEVEDILSRRPELKGGGRG